jgi:hypothetical protein
MDAAIGGRDGLVAPIGKNWVLSNELIGAKARDGSVAAALYGWAVAPGFKPPPGVDLHKGTLPGIQNIQPLSTVHSAANYTDYAMLTSLVRRDCVVDGVQRDLWDVLRDPVLSVLVSHEGPLRVLRQPGVPTLPPLQESTMASGGVYGFWASHPGVRYPPHHPRGGPPPYPVGFSPSGRPLAPGVAIQLAQHAQGVEQRQRREIEHPVKSGFSKFFWHLISIPLTTVAGITIGKLIERRKGK